MDKTPPGRIIDGVLEELANEEAIGAALELQGLSTLMLVGRRIERAETMGTDAIFAVELDDGTRFQFKMLSFDPPREPWPERPAIEQQR